MTVQLDCQALINAKYSVLPTSIMHTETHVPLTFKYGRETHWGYISCQGTSLCKISLS